MSSPRVYQLQVITGRHHHDAQDGLVTPEYLTRIDGRRWRKHSAQPWRVLGWYLQALPCSSQSAKEDAMEGYADCGIRL